MADGADGNVVFEIQADFKELSETLKECTRAIEQASQKWDHSFNEVINDFVNGFKQGVQEEINSALRAIGNQADNAAGEVETATDDMAEAAENSSQQMTKSMSRAFDIERIKNWAIAAVKHLIQFGQNALQAASDLQEVQNVVDVTFGSDAGKIESWAKRAQTQFGLTEIQAKRFTSTLGAMMKSADLTGPEIVDMSTDLAGLAADMASFYNMDFETAFSKIRSGLSGQTEPLKQLGINMSVANLEAYALSKGIDKAFSEMSQGEQVMLRYQYLMQATADAQGDFTRTSDSFENSKRKINTALASIEADIGKLLIGPLQEATTFLSGFLSNLTAPKQTTVLDEIAAIDIETETKLAQIQAVAGQANDLIEVLGRINNNSGLSEDSGLIKFIESFSGKVTGLDDALKKAKEGNVEGAISDLAAAFAAELGGDPEKWENLLKAVANNAGGAIEATKGDTGKTKSFLEGVAAGADDLTTDYSKYWNSLLSVLGDTAEAAISALDTNSNPGGVISAIASGANILKADSPGTWKSLLTTLQKVDGLENIFTAGAGKNVEDLANALSGNSPDTSKAQAWHTFLDALSTSPEALSALTKTNPDEAAAWLEEMAEAANKINPADADAWNKLLANFVSGLSGLDDTEAGQEFRQSLVTQFLALGTGSEEAVRGLSALGMSTEDIENAQKEWLETCKRLVQTIPGLSSIINTQTGEIKGGVPAIQEYVDAWKKGEEEILMWQAYYAKNTALQERRANEYLKKLELMQAEAKTKRLKAAMDALGGWDMAMRYYGFDSWPNEGKLYWSAGLLTEQTEDLIKLRDATQAYYDAWREEKTAREDYNREVEANKEAVEGLEDAYNALVDIYGEGSQAAAQAKENTDDLTESMTKLQKAADGDDDALKEVSTALTEAGDAFKALADYEEQVRKETESTVSQVISGFSKVVTPVQQAEEQMKDLTDQMNKLDTSTEDGKKQWESLNAQINKLGGEKPSVQNMTQGLESQLAYMREYKEMLDEAARMGVSEDILSMLSDGSAESYDYLKALTTTGGDITKLNEVYAQVQEESKAFTDALTQQKLLTDETYSGLVSTAYDAVKNLNQYDGAKESVEATVQGIVDGLADKASSVKEQVDSILAQIARLEAASGFGANFSFPGIGWQPWTWHSHETGLDYVPFDDYFAKLHEGESVLTAEEAKVWRQFKYGQQSSRNSFDYGAMGSAMWENAPNMGGGNVYLDGRIVGSVISDRQADSYRALVRSGRKQ